MQDNNNLDYLGEQMEEALGTNYIKRRKIYKQAIEKYGTDQLIQAIQELTELSKEINKSWMARETSINVFRESIVEEIADVEIMLAQLKEIYKIDLEELEYYKESKLKRLVKRMEGQEFGIIKKSECLQALKIFTQTEVQADE